MKSALFLLEEQVHLGAVVPSMVGAALSEQIGYLRGKAQHMSDTRILDTELDALGQILTGINALPGPMVGIVGSDGVIVDVAPDRAEEIKAEALNLAAALDWTPEQVKAYTDYWDSALTKTVADSAEGESVPPSDTTDPSGDTTGAPVDENQPETAPGEETITE